VGGLLIRPVMLRHNDVPLHFLTLLIGSVSKTGWNLNLVNVDGRSEN
jgi:hypothetical protein